MLVNCIRSQWVNMSKQDFTRVGILIQRPKDLYDDRTRPVAMKKMNRVFYCVRPDRIIGSFYTAGRQDKRKCFIFDGFCSQGKSVFEAMGCFYLLLRLSRSTSHQRRKDPARYQEERIRRV